MNPSVRPAPPRIENFDDLVRLACGEPQPQQLLVVLLRVEPVYRQGPDGRTEPVPGGGSLAPLAVKDYPIQPKLRFDALRDEADQAAADWGFMMLAVLPGRGPEPPERGTIDDHLKRMAQTVVTGGNLSGYLFLDREGEPHQVEDTTP